MAKATNERGAQELPDGETLHWLLQNLRALRLAAGWTQERFSEVAGLSYKYYQAVEAGRKRELRLSTLERLARAHRLKVWELLTPGTGKPNKPRKTSDHDPEGPG